MSGDKISPLELMPLEVHALEACADLASRTGRVKAFACYLAMREKICVDYLPLISSRQPFINDHTRTHLRRVLRHVEQLLVRHFPQVAPSDLPTGREISWADTIILLNALVWHDLGNIRGREGHAAEVHQLFKAVGEHLYEIRLGELVKSVAEAHSGDNAIARCIPDQSAVTAYSGEDVHPQFLAAVLRFADELDEDHERIPSTDYDRLDLVPQLSRRYWFFNKANQSIRIRHRASDVGAHIPWVQVHSKVSANQFDEPFETSNGTTTPALTEYLRRILKIEQERRYCNGYLRKAYHHTGVAGIQVVLDITVDHGDRASLEFELTDTRTAADLLGRADLATIHTHLRTALGT